MPGERLELSLLTEFDLKSNAATNYATRASEWSILAKIKDFCLGKTLVNFWRLL